MTCEVLLPLRYVGVGGPGWLAGLRSWISGRGEEPDTGLSLSPLRLESLEVRLCAIAINPRRSLLWIIRLKLADRPTPSPTQRLNIGSTTMAGRSVA
jgi:hypothetical protein